jgi:hypothetical protein
MIASQMNDIIERILEVCVSWFKLGIFTEFAGVTEKCHEHLRKKRVTKTRFEHPHLEYR